MCGIGGIMLRDPAARPDPKILEAMTAALALRGPDGHQSFERPGFGMVHARLAIIDLVTGDQPLTEPGGAVLIANGEIYNDPEIRERLGPDSFSTRSDCESPLSLYRREGLSFPERLRGMYAIALYDEPAGRLVLSRDPFGIKPLYYVEDEAFFAFSSSPDVLLAAGLAGRAVEPRPRSELLQLKFTTGRRTIFPQIRRMLPGETLVVEKGAIVSQGVRPGLARGKRRGSSDPGELEQVLHDSVRHHVRSDVPLGLLLSGGIDSAVLARLMRQHAPQPTQALTAAFPDVPGMDESAPAARVAAAVGAQHHIVELRAADFWRIAPQVAAALDDPTTDMAAVPLYILGRKSREIGCKVMLSGAGADEVFGGYSRYRRAAWMGPLARSRTKPVFRDPSAAPALFDGWRDALARISREERGGGRSQIQVLQAVDCAEWLPNDVLLTMDRCLMAHGVEGRTPFVDPVVCDYAFNLADNQKVRGKFGKWLLRRWLSENLPEAAAFAKKAGFVPPVGFWIASAGEATADLICRQPGLAEVFRYDAARAVLAQAADEPQRAWSLLFYALWHSRHILGVPAEGTADEILAEAARRG